MNPEDIPQELIDILDERAGKKHSRQGSVVSCLAEILTAYERVTGDPCPACGDADLVSYGGKHRCPACGYLQPCCQPG